MCFQFANQRVTRGVLWSRALFFFFTGGFRGIWWRCWSVRRSLCRFDPRLAAAIFAAFSPSALESARCGDSTTGGVSDPARAELIAF